MEKIVVTGATSFLGLNTINGLLIRGYIVVAVVREGSAKKNMLPCSDKLCILESNLDHLKNICNYVKTADCFIHFAWDGTSYEGRGERNIQEKNIAYSQDALEIAINLGCKQFVFAGSQAEYGHYQGCISEDDICMPVSEYGKAKLAFSKYAEERVLNEKISFLHLRIFSTYGYGDRSSSLINSAIDTLSSGGIFHLGPCTQQWNYLYIDDFVNIICKLINLNARGIINIGSDDTRQLREYVFDIERLCSNGGNLAFDRIDLNPEGSPNLSPDISKLLNEVQEAYKFHSFDDGIREILYKRNIFRE